MRNKRTAVVLLRLLRRNGNMTARNLLTAMAAKVKTVQAIAVPWMKTTNLQRNTPALPWSHSNGLLAIINP